MPGAYEDRAFVDWRQKVESEFSKKAGMDLDDLPDIVCLADMFEDGFTVKAAVRSVVSC